MDRSDRFKALQSRQIDEESTEEPYVLESQVGFLLRKAQQRHLSIFSALMPDGLTVQQFATLAKLFEVGPSSQNALGRLTGMDNSTINGVVKRLLQRGVVDKIRAQRDGRMHLIHLTAEGERLTASVLPVARQVSSQTTAPLSRAEKATLIRLLEKIS